MNRTETLSFLKSTPQVSVLIVGAGINGIGTFRDLALNGVDVLLIDRGDFCSGASAASSHMAHGGIRYLENGEFRLVREAVGERNRMIRNAPHIVKPLPTAIRARIAHHQTGADDVRRLHGRAANRAAPQIFLAEGIARALGKIESRHRPHRRVLRRLDLEP
ncbi:MAG: FAD-dependent oxidoreductase [Chloroflexi bacterium CFX1]|nr:FAD-dependent oxidoreductase [Chloroflexi bacterium CFX1]